MQACGGHSSATDSTKRGGCVPQKVGTLWKILLVLAVFWLGIRYLLPLFLPFLAAVLVAVAAEPAVGFLSRRLKMPRVPAAGVGVLLTLAIGTGLVGALGAVLLRQVTRFAASVPDLEDTARQGLTVLEDWLVGVTQRAPEGVQPILTGTVLRFFDNGSAMVDQMTRRLPGAVASVLSRVPDSALGVGTGLLASFMLSARLPKLRQVIKEKARAFGLDRYLPAVRKARQAAFGWLKAQGKLMLLTWLIVAVGFLLLGIRGGFLWAALIAMVDAVPMLGTGIVLLPWALVSLLQGRQLQALGLCALFAVATIARTTLEPRLVGKQLGLDPLVTLICLYAGYRLWGFLGLLIAPMLTGVVFSVLKKE